MKKVVFMSLAIIAAGLLPVMGQTQQGNKRIMYRGGPGIAVSGSMDFRSLPENAQTFINDLFPATTVTKVENDFYDKQYEVDLSDGYEVTFDYNGNWVKVEAPDGATLPSSTLTALVPETAVINTLSGDALLDGGVVEVVDEITVFPQEYRVEYATGKVGKGKASISKNDGAIIIRERKKDKINKYNAARSADKSLRQYKRGIARPVKY